ncbi:MAG: glutathione S-transferase family protein [Alphaproteobacteria bacterium]|nr:glutathione S-transferase family protein [Alphaproteobacteria bacterium]
MKIYHSPGSRSVRVIWLFEELDLPYELEQFKLGAPEMRSPEYLKVHPMGRVPALEDGDQTIFESGAIVQYVLAKYGDGALVPETDSPEFGDYLQWLHYAEGMLMPQINVLVVETVFLSEERRNQVNIDRAMKLLNRMLVAVDAHLAGRDYLAGEFSGADIMTGHACSVSKRLGADVSELANVTAYIERIEARPALVAAREHNG